MDNNKKAKVIQKLEDITVWPSEEPGSPEADMELVTNCTRIRGLYTKIAPKVGCITASFH